MNCPLCIDHELVPNHRSGIEIDVCPQCRGVWLDRGELDKLAGSASTRPADRFESVGASDWDGPNGFETEPRGSDRRSRDKGQKKRKKSLSERLGDVFEEVLDL